MIRISWKKEYVMVYFLENVSEEIIKNTAMTNLFQ